MLNQRTFWFIPGPGAAGPGQAGRQAGHDNLGLGRAGHCLGERQAVEYFSLLRCSAFLCRQNSVIFMV